MEKVNYHFERLTPVDDIDLDVYEDAINYVFDNSDIKNVAVSGAYSAGKSSVLATYKKKHKELKFLHISLAHFKSTDKEVETEVKESVLEGKILNQLIHQIPSDKIPQTNFRVKKKIKTKNIIERTIETVLFLIAVFHFIFFDGWKNYISTLSDNWFKSIISLSTSQYSLMIDGFIIIGLVFFIVYGVIKIQKNKNVFRKLNLQGTEIEIFEESEDSYFDKYLNEVLYLFENAEADVIVFEDMDRFNVNRIFERLREVNTLANIQLQKENKKILRFFYLLRDDIFVSKDRTKFFDYIIPIVPVIDSSNSYDQFIELFKKSGLFEKLDEGFLQGLSLYIDDMRLLKNIYNEFLIYYNRLSITELNCNKMLAIIAYKNLFPRDFADLQLNQGFVYNIFSKKDIFIAEEVATLNKRIAEKSQEIEIAKSEHIKTIKELDVVFDTKKTMRYGYIKDLSETDKKEYDNRKQAIENRLNNLIPNLEDEKAALEQELILTQNKQLCDIITRDNICSIFSITSTNEIGQVTSFDEIKCSEYFNLLKYLIRNGYIDETYADYMTYFYENSLNRIDKNFLLSLTDKKAKEYTYKLRNPQLIVSRLKLVDFDQEEILNFDLLTYLLHDQTHVEYIKRYMDQLKNTKNFKFVGSFFDTTTELPAYIKYLNEQWPEVFMTALEEKLLTEKQIRRYSIGTLYYSDNLTIELVNKNNCLCNYISNSCDYLSIEKPNIDKLIYAFNLIGICFIGFDYTVSNKDLFRAVYEDSLYEINADNLQLILREMLDIKNEKDIIHKNYTLLCSYPDAAITQYINQNINKYLNVILQMSGGIVYDDESIAIDILNNSDIIDEQKQCYIKSLQTVLTSIKEIVDVSLWSSLLDNNTVSYSEQNIMDYFQSVKSLDESIVSFINKCTVDLDFSKTEYESKVKEALFDSLIVCHSVENSKYEQILVSLNMYYTQFDIVNIPNDKLEILIDTNIIRMTAETLEFMRENYPDQLFYFIKKNMGKYIEIIDSDLFSEDELLEIISWDIIDDYKIKLLEFSCNKISIIGKDYSVAVCLYILKNNFMESDLKSLFLSFEQWDESIKTVIFNFAIRNIADIINNPKSISDKLKHSLFDSNQLDMNTKIELLIAMMPDINEDYIKEVLTLIGLDNYTKIFDTRSRPKFEVNNANKTLLTAFKLNKWIEDFKEDTDKTGYFKIERKKKTKKLPEELL